MTNRREREAMITLELRAGFIWKFIFCCCYFNLCRRRSTQLISLSELTALSLSLSRFFFNGSSGLKKNKLENFYTENLNTLTHTLNKQIN